MHKPSLKNCIRITRRFDFKDFFFVSFIFEQFTKKKKLHAHIVICTRRNWNIHFPKRLNILIFFPNYVNHTYPTGRHRLLSTTVVPNVFTGSSRRSRGVVTGILIIYEVRAEERRWRTSYACSNGNSRYLRVLSRCARPEIAPLPLQTRTYTDGDDIVVNISRV